MSFDKLQAMRNAERFLSQGKLRAAVNEYAQVVEHDTKDFNTLNILGDLYAKIEEKDEAVGCFHRVAEHYSKQGFAQKAIAIYNKIARLTPDSYEVSAKLAPLYHLKGSIVEAKSHYNIVAEHYQATGKRLDALNILKKIAELDPHNTEIYLKLAEGFWQEGHKDEALSAYNEAGARSLFRKQYEAAVMAFSRGLEINPDDMTSLRGFVASQTALGYADEALDLLEQKCAENPYNVELMSLLIDSYLAIDNPVEAEKVAVNLVAKEPSNYKRFLEVVEKYLKFNELDSAVRLLLMASEHLLVGGQAEELKKWVDEILARNPEQIDTLRLLVRYSAWMRDEQETRSALERLAESAKINDSLEDERYALTQLVAIVPHEMDFSARLDEIGGPINSEDLSPEQNIFAGFSDGDVPTFESYENLAGDDESSPPVEGGEGAPQFDFSIAENEAKGAGSNGDPDTKPADNQASSLSPSLEMHLHQELESVDFYIASEYNDLAADTLGVLEKQFGSHPEILLRKEKLGLIPPQTDIAPASEVSAPIEPAPDMPFADGGEENPDSAEFYQAEAGSDKTATEEYSFETLAGMQEMASPAGEENSGAFPEATGGFDAFDDFRSGLGLEDAEEEEYSGDYETHYNLGIAYKEMGLMDDAVKEFQDAVKLVAPSEAGRNHFQCCNLLGHCFMEKGMPNLALKWFEKCLETQGLSEEERHALRYEIALAYQEDGNRPRAIQYFEEIYSADVEYRDVSQRLQSLR